MELVAGEYSKFIVLCEGSYSGFDTSQLGFQGSRHYLSDPENELHVGFKIPKNVMISVHGKFDECPEKNIVEQICHNLRVGERFAPGSFLPHINVEFSTPNSAIYECNGEGMGKAEIRKGFNTSLKDLLTYFSNIGLLKKHYVSVNLITCFRKIPSEVIDFVSQKKTHLISPPKKLVPKIEILQRDLSLSGGFKPSTHGLLLKVNPKHTKFEAEFSNGKKVVFGKKPNYIDYYAQDQVLAQQKKLKVLKQKINTSDPFSAKTLTIMILWNKPTLLDSIKDYNTLFY